MISETTAISSNKKVVETMSPHSSHSTTKAKTILSASWDSLECTIDHLLSRSSCSLTFVAMGQQRLSLRKFLSNSCLLKHWPVVSSLERSKRSLNFVTMNALHIETLNTREKAATRAQARDAPSISIFVALSLSLLLQSLIEHLYGDDQSESSPSITG